MARIRIMSHLPLFRATAKNIYFNKMKTFFSLTIFFLFSLSVFCDAAQIFPQKNRTSFTVDD